MVYVLLSLAPIILTTFGALFLNEKARWRRWTAVILGFAGVVIVINPSELRFGYFFIFPLLSAILLSFRDMYTKKIKGNFHSLQIAFITCLVVTIFFGLLSICKFYFFTLKEFAVLFVSSFFLSLGYIYSIATIKVALVSVTSTFRYSVIIWGILYGYFYFFTLKEFVVLFVSSFFLSLGYIFSVATIKAALVSVTSTFRNTHIKFPTILQYI